MEVAGLHTSFALSVNVGKLVLFCEVQVRKKPLQSTVEIA